MAGKHAKPRGSRDIGDEWKRAARKTIAAAIGLIPVIVLAIEETELGNIPALAGLAGTLTVILRVLSAPVARTWIETYAPWLDGPDADPEHGESGKFEDAR